MRLPERCKVIKESLVRQQHSSQTLQSCSLVMPKWARPRCSLTREQPCALLRAALCAQTFSSVLH